MTKKEDFADLVTELDCMADCVRSIQKMCVYWTSQSDRGDSVATGQARESVERVINFLASFYSRDRT